MDNESGDEPEDSPPVSDVDDEPEDSPPVSDVNDEPKDSFSDGN